MVNRDPDDTMAIFHAIFIKIVLSLGGISVK